MGEPEAVNWYSYYNTYNFLKIKNFNYKAILNLKSRCFQTREKHFHENSTMGIFLNYRLQQQLVTRTMKVIAIAIVSKSISTLMRGLYTIQLPVTF